MNKTERHNTSTPICVSRQELASILGCGQATADKLAKEAGARIKFGKRVLIKVDLVTKYLDDIAG